MKWLLKAVLPLVIVVAGFGAAKVLIETGPKAERRPPRPSLPLVEVVTVNPSDYRVAVRSRGTVSPRTESTLIPEVAGRIVRVSPNFRPGGFFDPDEVLVEIDPRDYEQAVTLARAELAQAEYLLSEEQARADQARRDWEILGRRDQPSDLVLRLPQLNNARAGLAAARARLAQAETDLERTRIRAPYAGRVLEQSADLGQYVAPGNVLARLYAVDAVEVRLPLSDRQLGLVELPESYRGEAAGGAGPAVRIGATIAGVRYDWRGRIVRTEGAIDARTRQLFVVARVEDPYARRADGRPPLKVGQFVEAAIDGRTLHEVFVLPVEALRGDSELLVVRDDDRLERRRVAVVLRDDREVVIASGLTPGERVSLTGFAFVADGTPVRVAGSDAARDDATSKGP